MYFQMIGFTISGAVTHRIRRKQVVLVSETVVVHGHLKFPKHRNSSINLFSIAKPFYHHYKHMTSGKAANTYLGKKNLLFKDEKKNC